MGKVVHFEIPADDVKRAQDFYSAVFDWIVNPMSGMDYTIFQTGPVDQQGMAQEAGFINGGMGKRGGSLTHPLITIDVPDIEEAAKKIAASGGKMVQGKLPVGDMGFSAYFQDSEGNTIGLWENKRK